MSVFTTGTTRRAHLAALGGLGAPLVAACAGPGRAVAPADVKGTTVEYLGVFAPTHPEEAARTKVLEDFNARNTLGVKVNIAATAGQTAATMDQVISALAGGTPPDMVNSFHFNMSLFAARGATVDVDAELKGSAEWKKIRAAIYPHIVNGLTWKGKLFAVPSHNSSLLMYWHTNLLTRAGLQPPPKTWSWDQFVDYCKKASQPPEITGYDEAWSYRRTGMMVLNAGVQPISQDGTKLPNFLPFPNFPTFPEAEPLIDAQLKNIWAGKTTAKEGMDEAQRQTQPLLDRALAGG